MQKHLSINQKKTPKKRLCELRLPTYIDMSKSVIDRRFGEFQIAENSSIGLYCPELNRSEVVPSHASKIIQN
jgi:hypothetical protein